MTDKTFVDTNILVYAHQVDAGYKYVTAKARLDDLWATRSGVLSPQVLQEFYVTTTRKVANSLPKIEARGVVADYSSWSIEFSAKDVQVALQIEDLVKISFWDSLIVAAALKAGAARILTEDMNAGQTIAGILIVNPFDAHR